MAKGYKGWPSWNQWNVVFWCENDKRLSRLARECRWNTPNLDEAARLMLQYLPAYTPDGAPITRTAVKGYLSMFQRG